MVIRERIDSRQTMLVVDWCPKGRSRKGNRGRRCYNWFFVHFIVGKRCLRSGKFCTQFEAVEKVVLFVVDFVNKQHFEMPL